MALEELKEPEAEVRDVTEERIEVREERIDEVIEEKTGKVIEERTGETIKERTEAVIEERTEAVIEERIEAVIEERTEAVIEEKTRKVIEERTEEMTEVREERTSEVRNERTEGVGGGTEESSKVADEVTEEVEDEMREGRKEVTQTDVEKLVVSGGSYVVVVYGRRWYIAQIVKVEVDMYNVSYMTPSRGKWKWVKNEKGLVDAEDILMVVNAPKLVGKFMEIQESEYLHIREKNSQ